MTRDEHAEQAYERRRLDHLRALQELLPAELAKRSWSAQEFAAERTRRLRALIAHAKQHSPWHAERLAGVEPRDVSEHTLRELPSMTKSDLMTHWDDIVCDGRLTLDLAEQAIHRSRSGTPTYLFDEHQAMASGGSSGTRGVFVWDFDGLVRGVAIAVRFSQWVTSEVGPLQPVRTAYVQAVNPGHASHLIARCFGDPTQPALHLSPVRPMTELVEELHRFQPTQLVGYPSVLHGLAQEALEGRLRVPLQRIGCQAEPLLPETRDALRQAFDVPITELYGASECLNLAQGWPGEDFLRLCEDNAVLEPVREDGTPTGAGEPSAKLFLTNLLNRVLPLIRYELNDELTWVDAVPATRPGRGVVVAGRRDDVFRYGSAVVHPHVLRSALGRRDISEYQVRQTGGGIDVSIRAEPCVDVATVATSLERALADAGVVAPRVSVERVDRLVRHELTGKLKRFVPLPA